ncbi:MAG: hypothetical protein A2622_08530 [Bdellovibrionales bacterium RIFCSPHIGHO2_01_FULL_40_29]|nr:MAG: hypothetical protein A2622_08530 [Bdellovibrionales bacterium RIFCSPHIGHO2_01_FULL_40_29]OFZ35535.1 MAG: hypothetical protein A3D17_07765 [Bdellovibrionales bacterium RIFCSPHIGHO2_02_FULL_40_15]
MKFIIYSMLLVSSISFAAKIDKSECQDMLSNKRLEMNAISSNIENISATRTPEGGAYRKKEIHCENKNCKIVALANYVTKYLPDHPDADDSGYVKFPNIKVEEEMSAMIAASREYQKIDSDCK